MNLCFLSAFIPKGGKGGGGNSTDRSIRGKRHDLYVGTKSIPSMALSDAEIRTHAPAQLVLIEP